MNKKKTALLVAVLFVAVNMRSPITGVGPVAHLIRADCGFSGGVIGMLTSIPLLIFAASSFLWGKLSLCFGLKRSVLIGSILISAGCAMRVLPYDPFLFGGTAVVSLGIACENTLIPVLIRRMFPNRSSLIMGFYTATLSLFAGVSAAISLPLAEKLTFGWRGALGVWAITAALSIAILCISQKTEDKHQEEPSDTRGSSGKMLKSMTAWQVAFFMGLQSIMFYCLSAWLPSVYISKGVSETSAGLLTFVFQVFGVPGSLLCSRIASGRSNQRCAVVAVCSAYILGLSSVLFGNGMFSMFCAATFCGLGVGSSLTLSLYLIAARTNTLPQMTALSGMAQTIGYALASVAPPLLGTLYDRYGSWNHSVIALLVVSLVLLIVGLLAGRNKACIR